MQSCRQLEQTNPITYTCKQQIKTNSKHKTHKSYYLKPLGRITIASVFVLLAILCGMIYPQAGEGSVFLVMIALVVAFSKKPESTCKQ